mmetsp:Transcript_13775/g.28807  ORF Transcript_13775/g.28807 Transcript_13775/m.28807 type:complete len:277 (-) Transcript_13775:1863-2693(-)
MLHDPRVLREARRCKVYDVEGPVCGEAHEARCRMAGILHRQASPRHEHLGPRTCKDLLVAIGFMPDIDGRGLCVGHVASCVEEDLHLGPLVALSRLRQEPRHEGLPQVTSTNGNVHAELLENVVLHPRTKIQKLREHLPRELPNLVLILAMAMVPGVLVIMGVRLVFLLSLWVQEEDLDDGLDHCQRGHTLEALLCKEGLHLLAVRLLRVREKAVRHRAADHGEDACDLSAEAASVLKDVLVLRLPYRQHRGDTQPHVVAGQDVIAHHPLRLLAAL